jgi:hypothetical protein
MGNVFLPATLDLGRSVSPAERRLIGTFARDPSSERKPRERSGCHPRGISMKRTILTASALLALAGCGTPDPAYNTVSGGAGGAAVGAAIGCAVTIPIGCLPGAATGAIIGGASGGTLGLASTTPPYSAPPPSQASAWPAPGPPVSSYPYTAPPPYAAPQPYSAPPPPYGALPQDYPGAVPSQSYAR